MYVRTGSCVNELKNYVFKPFLLFTHLTETSVYLWHLSSLTSDLWISQDSLCCLRLLASWSSKTEHYLKKQKTDKTLSYSYDCILNTT